MGSGFKSFTAGSVLTASDMNNYLMEQSVMYFATTTARDTAITAPEDGMVVYIGSNDANEGLYTYQGAAWRKGPGWNAPWGYVANGYTGSTTAYTSGLNWSAVFTWSGTGLVANRRYLMQAFVGLEPAALGQVELEIGSGVGTGTESRSYYYANGTSWITTLSTAAVFTTTAGSMTRYVSMRMGTGTGGVRAMAGHSYQIVDIGPAGAPA